MFNTLLRLPANVWIIALSLSLAFAGVPLLVLISGLLAAELAPVKEMATLPLALNVVGVALSSIPVAFLAKRFGRKATGFTGLAIAFCGSLLCAFSTFVGSFTLLLIGAFFIGTSSAVFQQFRFAAIESLHHKEDTGPAISVILLCSVIAGFVGPEIGERGRDIFPTATYAGSFLLMAGVTLVAMLVWSQFKNPQIEEQDDQGEARPLTDIVKQPVFFVSVSASLIGYAVMSFLMTSTPISMTAMHGHSLSDSKWVIQSHLAAMFAPSLITGFLIQRFGIAWIMCMGSMMFIAVLIIALQGHALMHYWWSLVILGVAWNFLFISGTSLLPQSYRHSERFKVQAVNDFSVFASQALASLSAGWILFQLGWERQVWLCAPMVLLILLVSAFWLFRQKRHNSMLRHNSS